MTNAKMVWQMFQAGEEHPPQYSAFVKYRDTQQVLPRKSQKIESRKRLRGVKRKWLEGKIPEEMTEETMADHQE